MSNNAPLPLLMTRPLAAAQGFVAGLGKDLAARLVPIYTPLITIVPLKPLATLMGGDQVIFTSANGVAHGPDGDGRRAFCVGTATTQAARDRGWLAQQWGDTASDLLDRLRADPPQGPLVHLSGIHTRGDIAAQLTAQGLTTRNVAVYDQQLAPLTNTARDALAGEDTVLIPLFSPRTAVQFFNDAPQPRNAQIIAISDTVAACVPTGPGIDVTVSAAPNAKSMANALAEVLKHMTPG